MERLTDKRFLGAGCYQPKTTEERQEIQRMDKPSYNEIYQKLGALETKLETGELAEVPQGRWLLAGTFDDFAKCSVCGVKDLTLHEVLGAYGERSFRYCPFCGAKMSQEQISHSE